MGTPLLVPVPRNVIFKVDIARGKNKQLAIATGNRLGILKDIVGKTLNIVESKGRIIMQVLYTTFLSLRSSLHHTFSGFHV